MFTKLKKICADPVSGEHHKHSHFSMFLLLSHKTKHTLHSQFSQFPGHFDQQLQSGQANATQITCALYCNYSVTSSRLSAVQSHSANPTASQTNLYMSNILKNRKKIVCVLLPFGYKQNKRISTEALLCTLIRTSSFLSNQRVKLHVSFM